MAILRIQHTAPNFDGWKRAFDADPVDRRGCGVRRYQVYRGVADPNFVTVDLEFGSVAEADVVLEKLRRRWAGPGGAVMQNPAAWVIEAVESKSI